MRKHFAVPLLLVAFSLFAWPSVSPIDAKKPIQLDPVFIELSGDVTLQGPSGGPVESGSARLRSGNETKAEIAVRDGEVELVFAQTEDFFPGKFGDPDGAVCFGDPDTGVFGSLTLFDDGTATFQLFPEFKTADGEEFQLYVIFLEGTWSGDINDIPATGRVNFRVDFDQIEIATEGRGQNRRRTCRGTFMVVVRGFVTRPRS